MEEMSPMTMLHKARHHLFSVASLLRGGDLEQAIKIIGFGVAVYAKHKNVMIPSGRREYEDLLIKTVYLLSLDSLVKEVVKAGVVYVPGDEAAMVAGLQGLLARLREHKNQARERQEKACLLEKAERLEKGKRLLRTHRFDGAVQIFQRLCEEHAEDPQLHATVGGLLFEANHIECITFFEKAVTLDPGDHVSFALMGMALRKIKRFDQARDAYLAALACDGQNTAYLFNLSRVYMEACDWPMAQKTLRRTLEIDPALESAQKALAYAQKHCRDML